MTNAIKKLKQEEKKVILAYVQLKLKSNRLAKELDTMKQNIVDCFDRTNQNLIIVQDENGNSFGLQKINRKRKKFETANFKIAHNDLYNKFTTEIEYSEYKAIGDTDAK
tara:strand:+ start:1155 stop:1481 length:327 start_codon:yes stop_codon:yes gene_type:complete